MIRKLMTQTVLCVLFLSMTIVINGTQGKGFTPPLETNSGIVYPISLKTGADAKGNPVFMDSAFLQAICQQTFVSGKYIGYPFDLDDDGFLSKEECETVRVLPLSGIAEIGSLNGVEAFPKLRELYCNGTGVRTLNLSHNPRLQILACSDTPLTLLNISNCPLLKELKLSGCALACLNLSAQNELSFLTCQEQKRTAGGYRENGRYIVQLKDLDAGIDLKRISDVKIDGVTGDSVHSGYDSNTGIIYCSDEIKQISYVYAVDSANSDSESTDTEMLVTLTLSWGIRQAYETAGGSPVLPQFFALGEKDSKPAEPYRKGYEFTGWYTDASCKDRYYFQNVLHENITLYAGWKKKTYEIIYQTGNDLKKRNEKADWWSVNIIPQQNDTPTRAGYTFIGWKTESGLIINEENKSSITYGDASGNCDAGSTVLQSLWKANQGYQINLELVLTDAQKKQLEEGASFDRGTSFSWESTDLLSNLLSPSLPGHQLEGWYTARTGGTAITSDMSYKQLHELQFGPAASPQTPTIYGRFSLTNYTIHYDTSGGTHIDSRHNVHWGDANLLPVAKPKKKGYILAGWKLRETKVTKKTKLNDSYFAYSSEITLKAVWYKKYEPKGKIFKRYGIVYKITKSNKKGNCVRLLRITKKKITIRNKVFLNGKYFKLTSIKKNALKKAKKIRLKTPAKYKKKYRRMVKRAGGRIKK